MTVQEAAIAKIRELPEPLAKEVSDFIDFLLLKRDRASWGMWNRFRETTDLAEAGMDEYRGNLEDYETRLARGEIQW